MELEQAMESTPHGSFLVIDPDNTPIRPSRGILILGAAGIGKSHTALALIDRGHALVADDAPWIRRAPDGLLYGSCPASIQDVMEVRGLGLINVRKLLGDRALRTTHRLDMLIELIPPNAASGSMEHASEHRLAGHWQSREILASTIPMLTLHAHAAPMLALLIETAARNVDLQQRRV
jgi:HPr kinase/phosphorylase